MANQTILEGLNALLDHRAEVFIPELNSSFKCTSTFRIFGAQNPLQEGGGRKGLPKSFLNRFSRVHVDLLERDDLLFIAGKFRSCLWLRKPGFLLLNRFLCCCCVGALYPGVPSDLLQRMVELLEVLHQDARDHPTFGKVGGPWEFNLRDLLRWCDLSVACSSLAPSGDLRSIVRHYANMLLVSRMRTAEDRRHVWMRADDFLGRDELPAPSFGITPRRLQIGLASLLRRQIGAPAAQSELHALLNSWAPIMECLAECLSHQWMCLLVGPAGTGKTTIVRALAKLCGRELLELPLNNGTDTSDLLGGFEQVDVVRKRQVLIVAVQSLLAQLSSLLLVVSPFSTAIAVVQSYALAWSSMSRDEGPQLVAENAKACLAALKAVVDALPDSTERRAISHMMDRIDKHVEEIAKSGDYADGRFEWVDGSLTRQVVTGSSTSWVVCFLLFISLLKSSSVSCAELLWKEAGSFWTMPTSATRVFWID